MSTLPPRRAAVRGPVAALVIALLGAGLIAVLNGILAISAGLLAVAAVAAFLAARALAAGAASPGSPGRVATAIGLGVGLVLLGAAGSWALSLPQGGVLGPIDYVAQTMGPLLALLVAAGAAGAWAGGR